MTERSEWDRSRDVIDRLVDTYRHIGIECEPQEAGTVIVTATSYGRAPGRMHRGRGATYAKALLALGARLEDDDGT